MPPKVRNQTIRALQDQVTTQLGQVAGRIYAAAPVIIRLNDEKECDIDGDLITRMHAGARYTLTDWTKLCKLLLSATAPGAVFFVGPASALPALKDDETGFWIREVASGSNWQEWCFTVYKPSSKVVTTYTVKSASNERASLTAIANTMGTLPYMLSTVFHQETGNETVTHVGFQDAILFNMLVDVATGAFIAHERRLEDGPSIQLELLQALERLQIESEAVAAAQPSKRRRTLGERLAPQDMQQVVKRET